jgi:predicted negative regulator of RcsB-dependent stress response
MATTKKITRKDLQQDEFIETVFDFGEWLEKNWKRLAMWAGAVVVAVLVGFAWVAMRGRAADEANALLAKGMEALHPDPGADGKAPAANPSDALTDFQQAASKGGSQAVGDVARLYQARALIALNRASEATPILDPLSKSGNDRIAAQAKITLAEAAASSGDFDRAASILQDLASSAGAGYPPDGAMMLLAQLRERQGKPGEAKKIYDDIVAKYANGGFAAEARQRSTDLASGK